MACLASTFIDCSTCTELTGTSCYSSLVLASPETYEGDASYYWHQVIVSYCLQNLRLAEKLNWRAIRLVVKAKEKSKSPKNCRALSEAWEKLDTVNHVSECPSAIRRSNASHLDPLTAGTHHLDLRYLTGPKRASNLSR